MSKKGKRLLALAVLWTLAIPLTPYLTPISVGQEKSDAAASPVQPERSRLYHFAQGSFVAAAYADARTTELGLARGAQETNPLLGESPSNGRLYVSKVVVVCATLAIAARLRKAGHRSTALVVLFVGAGLQTAAAVRNNEVMR